MSLIPKIKNIKQNVEGQQVWKYWMDYDYTSRIT